MDPPVDRSDVAAVLAHVTAGLPGYEDRPGQVHMAELVAEAIRSKQHLVVQAGTGTGKTLAYLVGAIVLGEKVIVANVTANAADLVERWDTMTTEAKHAVIASLIDCVEILPDMSGSHHVDVESRVRVHWIA